MKTESFKRIKAFLLAAGMGTRLRPITNTIPKCLVPIGGKPLLEYWMDSLAQAGVIEVIVNTHWLAEKVELFAKKWNVNDRVKINTYHEPKLLGSAGTIVANSEWAKDADAIFVIYADNFSRFELRNILNYHFSIKSNLTIGVFKSANPTKCGIIEVDSYGRGVTFEEKPSMPRSNLAAAGVYVFSPKIIDEINSLFKPESEVFDLGFDVFPALVKKSIIYHIDKPLIDIGTVEAYEKVCRDYNII